MNFFKASEVNRTSLNKRKGLQAPSTNERSKKRFDIYEQNERRQARYNLSPLARNKSTLESIHPQEKQPNKRTPLQTKQQNVTSEQNKKTEGQHIQTRILSATVEETMNPSANIKIQGTPPASTE